MTSNSHSVNAPPYVHKFQCVGDACLDTCCNGWRVDIDKATYKRIKMLPQSAAHIKKHFKPAGGSDVHRFAYIDMGPDRICPIQTESGLCSIHSTYGEELLSKTCRFYPRKIAAAGASHEMHLTLSCPEAARLCLSSDEPHKMAPFELGIPKGKPLPSAGGFKVPAGTTAAPITTVFWSLRDLIFEVSQRQSVPLWELVLLVGMVCEQLERMLKSKESTTSAQIEMAVLEAKLAILDGSFHTQVDKILPEKKILGMRALYVQVLTNERLAIAKETGFQGNFFVLVQQAFQGFNDFMDEQGPAQRSWSDGNPIVNKALRNYLRNQVGVDHFPSIAGTDFSIQWRHVVIRYSLVSFYLHGLSRYHKDSFSMDHAVALVQSFTKAVDHNSMFLPRIDALMEAAGIDGVAGLGVLAR